MALTVAQIKQLIKNSVGGDIDFGGVPEHAVTLDIDSHWENNSMYALQPRVRQASTKLDCIRDLLGQLRYLADAGIQDLNPQVHTRFRNLQALEASTEKEIEQWKKFYGQQRPLIIKQGDAVAPLDGDCDPALTDANGRRLRGDAILPPIFRG